jgi:hypothetical protein
MSIDGQERPLTTLLNMKPGRLVGYNAGVQHYGEWLRGYDWQIYGCGTYRSPVNEVQARAYLKRFFERLEKRIRATVGYFASMERRYSGCGMSPIPIHWHFLAASENRDPSFVASTAQALWKDKFGDAKIDPYDPSGDAAFYVAKSAMLSHCSMEWKPQPFLDYQGPADLLESAAENPYVPDHLKNRVVENFLRYELLPAA